MMPTVSFLPVLIVLTGSSIRLCSAQATIVVNPQRTVVLQGREAYLTCAVQGLSIHGTVYWQSFPSGRLITTATNVNFTDEFEILQSSTTSYKSSDLKILAASSEGDHLYECVAQDGARVVRSLRAELDVIVPQNSPYPQCFLSPRQTVDEGDYAYAVCVSGIRDNILSWNKNGHPVLSTSIPNETYSAAEYNFLVTYEDRNMELTCYSSLNNNTCKIQQIVQYKPRVTIEPINPQYPQEDTARFTCVVDANPDMVAYRWEYDGTEIDPSYYHHRFNHFQFEDDGRILLIPRLIREDHGATVMCEAFSVLGSGSAITTLYVRVNTLTMETIGPIVVGCICAVLVVVLVTWLLWYFCCSYGSGSRRRRRSPPPDASTDLPTLHQSSGYGPDDEQLVNDRRRRHHRSLEAYENTMTEIDANSTQMQQVNDSRTTTTDDNPYSTPPSRQKSFKNLDLDDDDVGIHSGSYDVNPDPGSARDSTQISTYALSDGDPQLPTQNGR